MVFSISPPAFAANGTWLNTGVTSPSWVNANNWSAGTVPGATGGSTTNADVATFNTAVGANNYGTSGSPIIIDLGRNIGGITFDTATGNYFIGSTGLNPLLLTSGGTTSILSSLTATNAIETINAPLVLEGAAGTYTFSNNSANGAGAGAGTLNIGGGITGGAAGATVLSLSGSNTNLNVISGIITNGSATSLAITKSGVGTWVLTGANTYSGITTISGGTLQIGNGGSTGSLGTGAVTDNANLTFNLINSTIVSNAISGTGTLTQNGTGTLTLTSNNGYSGGTIINAGTLQVGNANALGTGAVVNNATLAIGTTDLSLGGAYTQNTGSALDLTANSSSSFGNITSTGHAAVVNAGSTVNVTVGGYIPNNAILEIVNTGGTGVTGSAPGTVNTSETGTSFYTPRVSFTSSILNGNLILTADHSSAGFASLANNSNARALGNVLDNEPNPSSDMTNVLNTLEFSSNAQTTAALNTLGPIVDRGVMDTTMLSLNNFIGASIERAKNVLTLASSGNLDNTGVSSGDDSQLNGLWAKQYGGYIDQGTREGIVGYNAWNTGTAVGLDHMFTDNLTIGASLGYAYGNIHSDENSATTYSNSAEGTLYAAYQGQNHPYFIDLAGTFANNWYDGQRSINIDNTINRTADSEYQGQQSGVYVDGGYKFDLGNNVALTPLASLQWTHLTLGSYTETNAGDLNLMINRQSYNILESGLGASISSQEKYNWGNLTPEFHAKWLYDFINDEMVVTSAFTGGGASSTSFGASPARDALNIGGSLSLDFKNDISLIAGVDTEIRDNFLAVYGSVSLRYKF